MVFQGAHQNIWGHRVLTTVHSVEKHPSMGGMIVVFNDSFNKGEKQMVLQKDLKRGSAVVALSVAFLLSGCSKQENPLHAAHQNVSADFLVRASVFAMAGYPSNT